MRKMPAWSAAMTWTSAWIAAALAFAFSSISASRKAWLSSTTSRQTTKALLRIARSEDDVMQRSAPSNCFLWASFMRSFSSLILSNTPCVTASRQPFIATRMLDASWPDIIFCSVCFASNIFSSFCCISNSASLRLACNIWSQAAKRVAFSARSEDLAMAPNALSACLFCMSFNLLCSSSIFAFCIFACSSFQAWKAMVSKDVPSLAIMLRTARRAFSDLAICSWNSLAFSSFSCVHTSFHLMNIVSRNLRSELPAMVCKARWNCACCALTIFVRSAAIASRTLSSKTPRQPL
mmetsp:Transcript_70961/g.217489  ORF Transcript_70961/g.217489 Transcript_70961/m.217489 type:complete len:293 (+) Transcript_70961:1530-2408(+)